MSHKKPVKFFPNRIVRYLYYLSYQASVFVYVAGKMKLLIFLWRSFKTFSWGLRLYWYDSLILQTQIKRGRETNGHQFLCRNYFTFPIIISNYEKFSNVWAIPLNIKGSHTKMTSIYMKARRGLVPLKNIWIIYAVKVFLL